jgi:hypothetical protein
MERTTAARFPSPGGQGSGKGRRKLSMLREGLKRGLEFADQPADPKRRLPPYYWAAFVLSGDWREVNSFRFPPL